MLFWFYAVKVQFMNCLYAACQHDDISYDAVIEMMIKNRWINRMHTQVPGTDGKLSYGGYCFPTDTKALYNFLNDRDLICGPLRATIEERDAMRDDNLNCVLLKDDKK